MFKHLRKALFWAHLIVGIAVSLVLLSLAFSGALLTYELQISEWEESNYSVTPLANQNTVSTDYIVQQLKQLAPNKKPIFVRWVNKEGAAVPGWAGDKSFLFHPYTGEIIREGQGPIAEFLHHVTEFHRWFALEGSAKSVGKTVTAYANLALLFLIVSGFYLWWPKNLSWKNIQRQTSLSLRYSNIYSKFRSWHFSFGFWILIPLFIIALSGTIFYFEWANKIVYGFYGESLPTRSKAKLPSTKAESETGNYSLHELYFKAREHAQQNNAENWHSMWMELDKVHNEVRFFIDKSIGHQPDQAYSLYFQLSSGEITHVLRKQDWSPGGQAWTALRYLHTGEYYGVVGQTIAGLSSLLACVLIYSGLRLSWRRFFK